MSPVGDLADFGEIQIQEPDPDEVFGRSEVPPPHGCTNPDDTAPIRDLDDVISFLP